MPKQKTSIEAELKMGKWSKAQLEKIAATDDLHISPLRDDGVTYGTPTWIWSVVVDGDVYVRAYNGKKSSWFQAAIKQKCGRISAAGMTKEVAFVHVTDSVNDAVDAAYGVKYKGSEYVAPMIAAKTRAATIKIVPALFSVGL